MQPWEQIDRTILVDTSFLKVYSDRIRLPDGGLVDDYTVIKKCDGVVIVATDNEGRLLAFDEYKYAVNQVLLTLPAGQIDGDEPVETAAARELLEETGYGGGTYEVVDTLFEYPSKDFHTVTVVRAKNVLWRKDVAHEEAENIGSLRLIAVDEVKMQISRREWKITSVLAALTIALPELELF